MIVTLHFVQQQVLAGSSSLFCDKDWQTLVASYYPHCTAELLLPAGVCSVCTPGPAVLQSPAAQQLPQLQEALQCLLWAGG